MSSDRAIPIQIEIGFDGRFRNRKNESNDDSDKDCEGTGKPPGARRGKKKKEKGIRRVHGDLEHIKN